MEKLKLQKAERKEKRRVSYMEIFYDLVYIALIARLTHTFTENISVDNFIDYIVIFTIVWWSWTNSSVYYDLHGDQENQKTRLIIFLQMFCIIGMAVYAPHAIGNDIFGFTVFYIGLQCILAFLWFHVSVTDKTSSNINKSYALTRIITAVLFTVSLFVARPYCYFLWASIGFINPLILKFFSNTDKDFVTDYSFSSAMMERYSLFVIIAIGEIITGIIEGLSMEPDLGFQTFYYILSGLLFAFGVWLIYFEYISEVPAKNSLKSKVLWQYFHLFLIMAISFMGTTIYEMINLQGQDVYTDEIRLLLSIPVGLVLLFSALTVLIQRENKKEVYLTLLIFAILSAGTYFLQLHVNYTLGIVLICLLAPSAVIRIINKYKENKT
jgi:low temperature requirement protein LtrA